MMVWWGVVSRTKPSARRTWRVRNARACLGQCLNGKGDPRASGGGFGRLHTTLRWMVVGSATLIIRRSAFLNHSRPHKPYLYMAFSCDKNRFMVHLFYITIDHPDEIQQAAGYYDRIES